jgi:hypothetical protein
MNEQEAVAALVSDLYEQIDQMKSRGIKNQAGHPMLRACDLPKPALASGYSRGKSHISSGRTRRSAWWDSPETLVAKVVRKGSSRKVDGSCKCISRRFPSRFALGNR